MEGLIIFVLVSVILTLMLNSKGSEKYIRDKNTNNLIFRFKTSVRYIALIGISGLILLSYKTVPLYMNEIPPNWFAVVIMIIFSTVFLWFYIYVTLTRAVVVEDEKIIHYFPFWKKELFFSDVKEMIWTKDRAGGNFVAKGEKKKITIHAFYVDYFSFKAKVSRYSKHAKQRKIDKC